MRVLVLDDERENVDILADTLRSEGFEVGEFTCARQAVRDFHGNAYDVVITDICMPEMDGLEVLREVKNVSSRTRVILVTGFASTENAIQAVNSGAYRFFRKPLDLRALVRTLRLIEVEQGRERTLESTSR